MCAVLVVVANILREPAFQVAFVNCDDVIQEIMPATPYPTLCNSILPRTFERSADRIHPQGSNRRRDFQSILGITIKYGDSAPRYLLRDRDGTYGRKFCETAKWLAISEVLTAPQPHWQNPYVERLIGSIRRECQEHVIVFNGAGL